MVAHNEGTRGSHSTMGKPCCDEMALDLNRKCEQHPDRFDCPKSLMAVWRRRHHILIHDGGSSGIEIFFCPWCGKNLKPKRSKKLKAKRFLLIV